MDIPNPYTDYPLVDTMSNKPFCELYYKVNKLYISGMMCSDPGTPGGMTQLATSYEIGAKLSYRCTRSGFEPTGPQNYTCQYDAGSGSAVWSDNLTSNPPSCQGIHA